MHPIWQESNACYKEPAYLPEFHSLMRNLEDLNGTFPDVRMMEHLRQKACSMIARGASTMVAARQIRRIYKLPVPFLSKYDNRWDTLNAETMRTTAKRGGKRGAPWNEGEKSRGRAALVREAEVLAIAKGFRANLFRVDDAGRTFESFESEEGTLHTASSTNSNAIDAHNPEASDREMAEGLLALSSGEKPSSTRPTTIRLKIKRTRPQDPEVVNSEMEDRSVQTKRQRRSQGTRHTATFSRPKASVRAAPQVEATELAVRKVARTRRRQPQGTRRTLPPGTGEPNPEAQSDEATPRDVVQEQQPERGTKRPRHTTHPLPARDPAAPQAGFEAVSRTESNIRDFKAALKAYGPRATTSSAVPVETTAEPAAKRVKKSPNDSGASPTSVGTVTSTSSQETASQGPAQPAIEERKLTREEEFELVAAVGAGNVYQPRQPRARAKRPAL